MKEIRILLAEDDEKLRHILVKYLKKEDYMVLEAGDGVCALALWAENHPDLVILDINMPLADGFEVLSQIREEDSVPVLLLTARQEEQDKIEGFEYGADDYVTKPFSPRVLMARVRALLRRSGILSVNPEILLGEVRILPERGQVFCGEQPVSLTEKEYGLLMLLINHRGQVLSRIQMIERIWGYDFEGDHRVVDTTIKRIRKKLGSEGSRIESVRGVGYRIQS